MLLLCICFFSYDPESQRLIFTSNMTEFLKKSKLVVEIKFSLDGHLCFSFAFSPGLAHLKDGTDPKGYIRSLKQKLTNQVVIKYICRDTAVVLHTTILELDPQSFVTWHEMKFLEQYY